MFRLIAGSILATSLVVVLPILNFWYWTQLPAEVAIHFNAAGKPDDWMPRTSAILLMLALQIGLPVFILALVACMDKLPNSTINIPNREYWLKENRRDATLRFVFDSFLVLTIVLVVFMSALNHLTFQANLVGQALNIAWFLTWLGIFIAFIIGFIVQMYRRFRLPPSNHSATNMDPTSLND